MVCLLVLQFFKFTLPYVSSIHANMYTHTYRKELIMIPCWKRNLYKQTVLRLLSIPLQQA